MEITPRLRAIASECAEEMHKLYQSRRIPIASKGKHCERCSLKDICMPEVNECAKVGTYLKITCWNEKVIEYALCNHS